MTLQEKPIRVVVVDDHYPIHVAVETLLVSVKDIELVGQGTTGLEAITLCEDLRPDVVLMDVLMPGMNGVEATRILTGRFPDMKILVISALQDYESILGMLNVGAVGYITKNSLTTDLAVTIRTVVKGKAVFSHDVVKRIILEEKPTVGVDFGLTSREKEILQVLAMGLTLRDISVRLNISVSTVKFHIDNVYSKMGVETRSEALIVAARNKLV